MLFSLLELAPRERNELNRSVESTREKLGVECRSEFLRIFRSKILLNTTYTPLKKTKLTSWNNY